MTNNTFGQHYIASYRQRFLIFCKITIDNLTFLFVFDLDTAKEDSASSSAISLFAERICNTPIFRWRTQSL